MTNQESKKILQRDLATLIENKSLPDGIEAIKVAISALGAIEQYKWERDVAISQLEELGLCLGQKIYGVYITHEQYNELLECKYRYESLCN